MILALLDANTPHVTLWRGDARDAGWPDVDNDAEQLEASGRA